MFVGTELDFAAGKPSMNDFLQKWIWFLISYRIFWEQFILDRHSGIPPFPVGGLFCHFYSHFKRYNGFVASVLHIKQLPHNVA